MIQFPYQKFRETQRLYRQGMTVLMATHDYRLVRQHPARTLALTKGRLVEVAPEVLGAAE